jgi:hypothetical protein
MNLNIVYCYNKEQSFFMLNVKVLKYFDKKMKIYCKVDMNFDLLIDIIVDIHNI